MWVEESKRCKTTVQFLTFFSFSQQEVDQVPGAEEDAHGALSLPSQADIERMLLERRKQMLMQQYASEALVEEEGRAKRLAGLA